MPKPTTPVAGARAGRYLFVRQITTSYTGALWEARCEADGGKQFLALARVVSLPGEMDAGVEECLASAAWDGMELDGEGIARVAEVVFEKGWFAIVHDHYDGETIMTLQRRVTERKSAFPVPVALRILLDAIEAVDNVRRAAKELDLPWRAALHPGSLFVCDDGRTRLLDGFMSGVIPGIPNMAREADTLAYSAPEQFELGAEASEASDVFALGILAWELLSSKRFQVGSRQVMERRLQTAPSRVDQMSRVGKRASRAVADAVSRALSNEPGERFESLGAFAKALEAGDDGVAKQQEVIEFTDALAGRESTLARLLMDKPPRLSDELRQERPQARKGETRTDEAKPKQKKAGRAPDAMFKPTPAQAAAAKAPGPALFGAKAAESAGNKATAAPDKEKKLAGKYGSPLAPPLAVQSRKQTVKFGGPSVAGPVPSKSAAAGNTGRFRPLSPKQPLSPAAAKLSPPASPVEAKPVAAVASASAVSPKPRNKFATLIGLSAEDVALQGQAAKATTFEPEEAPRDPDSGITAVDAKHQRFDEADEEPTTIFRIGESQAHAAAKSALDLSEDEQELETREYSQEMLADALGEAPESEVEPPTAPQRPNSSGDDAVAPRAALRSPFAKPARVAVPAPPALPIAGPATPPALPIAAPAAPPPLPVAAPAAAPPLPVPVPLPAAPAGNAPAIRVPAPSSPGFEHPGELPPLEHSGPPAVLPALKVAVLPESAPGQAAPPPPAGAAPVVAAGRALPEVAPQLAREPQSSPANRYRMVAFFFAGTTLLMAAAAVVLFLYARSQPQPEAPAPDENRVASMASPQNADPAPEVAPKAPEPSAEQKAPEAEAKTEEGEAKDADAKDEGEAEAESPDSAEAEAANESEPAADAAPEKTPKPARRSKPRRRSKPKAKPNSTRYVPTDI